MFSGRRREGDIQFYLESLFRQGCPDGTTLHVVSLDVVIDETWGNVRCERSKQFWLRGVEQGWILGALCGPPCETWSQARFATLASEHKGPRPLRSAFELWGLPSLSLKEVAQVAVGNELLLFAIELLFVLAIHSGFGILEHPAEPADPSRPSIWRLPLMRLRSCFSSVRVFDFAQGLLGAATPKPTSLLALNLPSLPKDTRAHHVCSDLPRRSAIGLSDKGHWNISPLKEYPPALNRAMASAVCSWFQGHPALTLIFFPNASPWSRTSMETTLEGITAAEFWPCTVPWFSSRIHLARSDNQSQRALPKKKWYVYIYIY